MLAARARRPVRVDAQVVRVDLGHLGVVERRHRVERRERGLAARVGVERRDADEPVHAAFAREQTERVATLHRERGRAEAGFGAGRHLVDLDGEAAPLGPAQVHAQEHVGPVLRVGAARAGVDRADRVAVVVLAGEQRAQLQRVELTAERGDAGVDLLLDRVVALLARELGERLEVGDRAVELVDERDVFLELRELGVDLAGAVLVVPEVGLADLDLELPDPGRGRRRSSGRRARLRRGGAASVRSSEKSRMWGSAVQRPWQSLYFLPLPQKQGSLRPGVLSTFTGIIDSGSGRTGSGEPSKPRRRSRR